MRNRNSNELSVVARQIGIAPGLSLRDAAFHREAMLMRKPETAEAGMARINGVLLRTAIVVAIAAATVVPLLR